MEKWEMRPDPKAADPCRHVLLVKGSTKDIAQIIKKLGDTCGRPSTSRVPKGYDFRLPLHKLGAAEIDKIYAVLEAMVPPPPKPARETKPERPPLKPGPRKPDLKELAPEPPLPVPPLKITPAPLPDIPKFNIPSAPPAQPAERPLPQPQRRPEPAPAPAKAAAPAPAPAAAEPLTKVWHTRQKLDVMLNFESLLVGPYNRFAHAAAASAVDSPGTMYNPLFLYGPPGSGKSHLIHAAGGGLLETLGEDQVIFTSGPRLAHAANIAVSRGAVGKLEAFFKTAKALVVDDFHLLAVSEENSGFLARVFEHFLKNNLQVVLTSLYAPRALGSLEAALKISLKKGWSVDLKTPPPSVQLEIADAFFNRSAVDIGPQDISALRERVGADYPEMVRWMGRLAKYIRAANFNTTGGLDRLLDGLFEPTTAPLPSIEQMAQTQFRAPKLAPGARGLAFVMTKGDENIVAWMMERFYGSADPLGLSKNYKHALTQLYDANQPFGAPFQIGESCLSAGAHCALIVGPPANSPLAARAAEFSYAVVHVLESLGLSAGWISNSSAMTPQDFMRAHLDVLPPITL